MASISYLWLNRARFTVNSANFYRAWAKRLLSLPELLRRNNKRSGLVRKGAIIHQTAEIGELTADGKKENLLVGEMSFIGRVNIALYEKVEIGNFVCINDGVQILTGSHDVKDPQWRHVKKKITIDDYAWIGIGAIILPGVHIGKGAVVGAGAVVSKSVEPGNIVVGNPAKTIPQKRCQDFDYNPCEFLSANRAWLVG